MNRTGFVRVQSLVIELSAAILDLPQCGLVLEIVPVQSCRFEIPGRRTRSNVGDGIPRITAGSRARILAAQLSEPGTRAGIARGSLHKIGFHVRAILRAPPVVGS